MPKPITFSHFVRELMECDVTGMEGLVKGQIKLALTVMSIKPGRQRLLSEQYLSLGEEKRPLVLHLKSSKPLFLSDRGWLPFQLSHSSVCRISLFFLLILSLSLTAHAISLSKSVCRDISFSCYLYLKDKVQFTSRNKM